MVLWLGRRQNGDAVEWWWGEWTRLRRAHYSSGGWEMGYPWRVAGGGDAYSFLWFWL
jgi:hypothetical protein